MNLIVIAGVSQNNVIGNKGKIPWHIPEDLQQFKQLTLGFPVIMGRKTFESLPQNFRPLPGRTNIVLTRQTDFFAKGVIVQSSLEQSLAYCKEKFEKAFIIGGQSVYAEGMQHADTLEITHVQKTVEGDAFFPEIDETAWEKIREEKHDGFSFCTYVRK